MTVFYGNADTCKLGFQLLYTVYCLPTNVENEESYTSTPPVYLNGTDSNNFTLLHFTDIVDYGYKKLGGIRNSGNF
jgi:hypothetical protein